MILIITNSYEPSTDMVIDWLISKKADFIRVNSEDITQVSALNKFIPTEDKFVINGQIICRDDINVIWYRRWYDYKNYMFAGATRHLRQAFNEARSEATNVSEFFFASLADKKWLTNPFLNKSHNKLTTLRIAERQGLLIPPTIVTNSKEELIDFYNRHDKNIITKAIGDPYVFIDETNGDNYKSFTEKITLKFINKTEPYFFLSLFQACIKAVNEFRVFYLDGEFYATAITNSKTTDVKLSVSFGVSQINMARVELPHDIKVKLHALMQYLKLNTGSIDLLQTHDGQLYFLEVNPIGQFMGYSARLNYYLDEKIADWLIQNDQNDDKDHNQISKQAFAESYN